MTTPSAMPTRLPQQPNPLHQQILGSLIKLVPSSWTQKAIDPNSPDPRKPQILEIKHTGQQVPHTTRREARVKNVRQDRNGVYTHDIEHVDVPVPTLAGNVSTENIERMAKRWIA